MPIGVSVDDIFSGIEFIHCIVLALEESAGARVQYRGVISTLKRSEILLKHIGGLEVGEEDKEILEDVLAGYSDAVFQFVHRVRKYDRSLGEARRNPKWRVFFREVRWQRYGKEEVNWFQAQLTQHAGILLIVMNKIQ